MKILKSYIIVVLLSLFFTISCNDNSEDIPKNEEDQEEVITDEEDNSNDNEEVTESIIKPSFKFDIEKRYVLPEFSPSDDSDPLAFLDQLSIPNTISIANANILANNNITEGDELTPDDKPIYFFDGTIVTNITAAENRVKDVFPDINECLTDSDIFTKRYLWASSTSEFEEAILGSETIDVLNQYSSYIDVEVGETDTYLLYAEKYLYSNINDPSIKEYHLFSWKVKKGDLFEGCLVVSLENESLIKTSEWKEENNSITVSTTHTEADGDVNTDISYVMNTDKSGELTDYIANTKYTWTSNGVFTKTTIE